MAVKKTVKSGSEASKLEPSRKPGNQPKIDEDELEAADDEEGGSSEISVMDSFRPPHEPDPREVDSLTDRIFGEVLSRYGWERHGGRIEHVGEEHDRHHPHRR